MFTTKVRDNTPFLLYGDFGLFSTGVNMLVFHPATSNVMFSCARTQVLQNYCKKLGGEQYPKKERSHEPKLTMTGALTL
jgi:hypothetical protein